MKIAVIMIGRRNITSALKYTVEEPFEVKPVSYKKQSRDIMLSATSPTEANTLKNTLSWLGQSRLNAAADVNI